MRTTLLALAVLASPAFAQTSYPMITHVQPIAVQRGKTATVEALGQQNFAGAYKALFEGAGLSAEALFPTGKAEAMPRSVPLKVSVAADAAAGVREFRLASRLG